ncbi:hypothetical protein IFM89_011934 [Coptis chinensis]|uniref:F-box domain-containing protein n=1 Tax=Coptis chinensis TaxID=261450 RepID=A0A835H2N3_9MAGN|nr:hypothetical protein IFM89_011934 [Coptis chinensis]
MSNNGSKSSVDRISDLPDPMIHHIFSFLDMREVVQTSILSKRWTHLWKSTPNLDFYLSQYNISGGTSMECWKTKKFINLVNQVLVFRDTLTYTSSVSALKST